MKKAISLFLICTLIAAMCIVFAGCGDNAAKDKETNATDASAATAASNADGSQDSTDVQGVAGHSIFKVWYAGISEQGAGMKALENIGENGLITDVAAGYYTDGTECWVVSVNGDSGAQYTCYISGDYCYVNQIDADSIFNSTYAGISEQEAGMNALNQVGVEGAYITGTSKGTGNDGEECWYIYIADPDGNYYTYMVTGLYCIAI